MFDTLNAYFTIAQVRQINIDVATRRSDVVTDGSPLARLMQECKRLVLGE